MPPNDLDFSKHFNEKLKARGLSLKKLSELSGISLPYLESMAEGDFAALPSAPYVRGYLAIVGEILDLDAAFWWEELRARNRIKSSGAYDELPRNRFAPRSTSFLLWAGIAVVLIVGYLGIRFSAIFGKPLIEVTAPAAAVTTVNDPSIVVAGRLTGGDELLVNREPADRNPDGTWQKAVTLDPGLNVIEITATKFLGRRTTITRQVVYEPAAPSAPGASGSAAEEGATPLLVPEPAAPGISTLPTGTVGTPQN
jgi:cytoskeletal protein RodZ